MAEPTILDFDHDGNYVLFTLSNKPEAVIKIDREDYKKHVHNTNHWYVHYSQHQRTPKPYVRSHWTPESGHKHLHREILGIGNWSHSSVGDHINGDSLDCRKLNLRECTTKENVMNGRSPAVQHLGIAISRIRADRYPNGYYQAYRGKEYIASGVDLEGVKQKIELKLSGELHHEG